MNEQNVAKIRAFNRFYTSIIGLLNKYLLDSNFTLPEVRVMYEIDSKGRISSKDIIQNMGIDKGYLSRLLIKLQKQGIIQRTSLKEDGRVQLIQLTPKGVKAYSELNQAAQNQIAEILGSLPVSEQDKLVQHFEAIQKILKNIDTNEITQ